MHGRLNTVRVHEVFRLTFASSDVYIMADIEEEAWQIATQCNIDSCRQCRSIVEVKLLHRTPIQKGHVAACPIKLAIIRAGGPQGAVVQAARQAKPGQ